MRHRALIILILFCTTGIVAQNVYDVYPERAENSPSESKKSKIKTEKTESQGNRIFTGFTGGMKFHAGYSFSTSPDELFHNASLNDFSKLPRDGVTMGLGGELRLHLINHIHLGIDGGMSIMPFNNGSSIRNGWGGALCGFYGTISKVQLTVGGVLGGGSAKRLYVPETGATVTGTDAIIYNASYTETPYFLLDPYVGLELALSQRIGLLIKVDYLLPFGKGNSGITAETIRWSNFLSPSGPRVYIGIMFGRHDRRVLHL